LVGSFFEGTFFATTFFAGDFFGVAFFAGAFFVVTFVVGFFLNFATAEESFFFNATTAKAKGWQG
jgi:hypothetical protein